MAEVSGRVGEGGGSVQVVRCTFQIGTAGHEREIAEELPDDDPQSAPATDA